MDAEDYDKSDPANVNDLNTIGLSRADHRHYIASAATATYANSAGTATNCTSQYHSQLTDILNDTWGDDHHSGADPVGGGGVAYLANMGTVRRNAMQQGFGDYDGDASIMVNHRQLWHNDGFQTVDWQACAMYDSYGSIQESILWTTRQLVGPTGDDVIVWNTLSDNWKIAFNTTNLWDKDNFSIDITTDLDISVGNVATITTTNGASWTTGGDIINQSDVDGDNSYIIGPIKHRYNDVQLAAKDRIVISGDDGTDLHLGGYYGGDDLAAIYYNGLLGVTSTDRYMLDSDGLIHQITITNGAITDIG